jgi:yecA family protein
MAYPIINAILVENQADSCAAEAHGMATGLLCANEKTDSQYWLDELLPNDSPISDEQESLLIRLFEETRRLLTGDDFEFDLFLPDDNTLITEKISALSRWCQGFLFGVGYMWSKPDFSKEANEILKDIAEFTKLDTEDENENEENELALMELTEYLRTAVLLLRAELNQQTDPNDQ